MESNEAEQKNERIIMQNENTLREISGPIKNNNICIISNPKREERETGAENLSEEITAENFPDLGRKQLSRSRRHRSSPQKSTLGGPHQDTY